MRKIAELAGVSVMGLVNPKSKALKEFGQDIASLSPEKAAEMIHQNPRILIRPIVTDGKQIVLGFNEERYQFFLS